VAPDEIRRAYRFGKRLVPADAEDETAMKLRTVKGCEVLGALSVKDVGCLGVAWFGGLS
jgi:hypothetical protein